MYRSQKNPGFRIALGGLAVVIVLLVWLFSRPLYFSDEVMIDEGDTLYSLVADQSGIRQLSFKLRHRFFGPDNFVLQVGRYTDLQGRVSQEYFFERLEMGPEQSYVRVKFLEGWSIYDYDRVLSQLGLVQAGDYIDYVTDADIIDDLRETYGFLDYFGSIRRLEGFLYPDTYFLDDAKPIVPQLVNLQLQTFNDRVWSEYSENFLSDSSFDDWGFSLSPYEILSLVSIVEKEERVVSQQDDITGVFLNRVASSMRLDADITLCYGLETGYETCSPSVIVRHLYDSTNLYNTRQLMGFTPTPIASPTAAAVGAVFSATKHDFFYYLHDSSGTLHMSRDLGEHNTKKQRYL